METGIRLRSLLDGLLNDQKIDYTDYRIRNQIIDRIEESLNSADWIELPDGTTYKKVFTPTYFKEQEKELEELRKQPLFRELNSEEELQFRAWARENYEPHGTISETWHPIVQDECRIINQEQDKDVWVKCISLQENRLKYWADVFEINKVYKLLGEDEEDGTYRIKYENGTKWCDKECFEIIKKGEE